MSSKPNDKFYTIIGGVICAVIAVIVIFVVNMNKTDTNTEQIISSSEAQKKCVIMESIDGLSVDNARKYCLSQWNTPEKEKEFHSNIEARWQERKDEVADGSKITGNSTLMSLQEIYDSVIGDI